MATVTLSKTVTQRAKDAIGTNEVELLENIGLVLVDRLEYQKFKQDYIDLQQAHLLLKETNKRLHNALSIAAAEKMLLLARLAKLEVSS